MDTEVGTAPVFLTRIEDDPTVGDMTGDAWGSARSQRGLPRPMRSVLFLISNLPLRLIPFALLIVGFWLGVGTAVVWIGLPILIATFALNAGLANFERRRIGAWLGWRIEAPRTKSAVHEDGTPGSIWRRFFVRLSDAVTWRAFAYNLVTFPIAAIEFGIGLAGMVLLPLGLWVAPRLAWLDANLASALLGPTSTTELRAKAHHLQASRARGVDAAEAERRRIERDLHDGAQQRLVAVAMGLGRAKSKLVGDPAMAMSLIDEAHADAKLAIAELRDLARGIYPAVLGDRGLDAALSALAAKCPVPVDVTVQVEPRPPTAVESCAYFLVGECLTNVAKHSQASRAQVRVTREDDKVVVEVTDNGKGGAQMSDGGGLTGLADRAATIDGVVTAVSPIGGPTVIRADLPCAW